MAETTYVLGAGANRCLSDLDGLRPPLAQDFFQQMLRHRFFAEEWHLDSLRPLVAYIERYWHRTTQDLLDKPFDLEECYTILQLQRVDAEQRGDRDTVVELLKVENLLTACFAGFLDRFFDPNSFEGPLYAFAELVGKQRAAVITFNYDTLLEEALKSVSGVNTRLPSSLVSDKDVADEDLTYSHCNWNPPRAYGVEFDEVQLYRAGPTVFVSGEQFYGDAANTLYEPPLLKLHGSLNWFIHSGVMLHESLPTSDARRGRTGIYEVHHSFGVPPLRDAELLVPIIVTPVLNKPIRELPLLPSLWRQARNELESCERLVIVGYSFRIMSRNSIFTDSDCWAELGEIEQDSTRFQQLAEESMSNDEPQRAQAWALLALTARVSALTYVVARIRRGWLVRKHATIYRVRRRGPKGGKTVMWGAYRENGSPLSPVLREFTNKASLEAYLQKHHINDVSELKEIMSPAALATRRKRRKMLHRY